MFRHRGCQSFDVGRGCHVSEWQPIACCCSISGLTLQSRFALLR